MTTGDDEREAGAPQKPAEERGGEGPSATRDLADGLELVLRAARKAMRNVDSAKLEDLGRRAIRGLEQVDRHKVQDFGRKAVQNLDPRRVEEVAEDAGRELLAVVERVAERIDGLIGGARQRGDAPSDAAPADQAREAPAPDAGGGSSAPRIRVDTDDRDR